MASRNQQLPIVYSCSGCSSAAQMANRLAVRLDRAGLAEMSCIAGVGGDVPSLVRVAKSGRAVIAIDGCQLHCVRNCLARHAVAPSMHLTLTDVGIKKKLHMEYSEAEAAVVYDSIAAAISSGRVAAEPALDIVGSCK
jgi:uncharacterized metal-binding protein